MAVVLTEDNERRGYGSLRSWQATLSGPHPMPIPDNAVLRLPDGREGRGVLADVRFSSTSQGQWSGLLAGSGPPPGREE
ncbi:hypothetical protein HS041_22440 [Planomonospora sp. ID67723]|uniref:hypothetical protein n=1 Tax=Planomonospora sp. ID67723 TaxID=2738134 RepID=UPI0018C43B23|nr:hypothetical protein [Planomonospora sp. ID67723]MBG0830524.1 hypothetical protein [Planomonospora sp. ID67723]